eukprot:11032710-Lingulodinium_polyedra.AAC.1
MSCHVVPRRRATRRPPRQHPAFRRAVGGRRRGAGRAPPAYLPLRPGRLRRPILRRTAPRRAGGH